MTAQANGFCKTHGLQMIIEVITEDDENYDCVPDEDGPGYVLSCGCFVPTQDTQERIKCAYCGKMILVTKITPEGHCPSCGGNPYEPVYF